MHEVKNGLFGETTEGTEVRERLERFGSSLGRIDLVVDRKRLVQRVAVIVIDWVAHKARVRKK